MRDAALLFVWLAGLFSLIGGVLAAVARFIVKDSTRYDEEFTWAAFAPLWNRGKDAPDETGPKNG